MDLVQRIANSDTLHVLFGSSKRLHRVLIGDQKSMDLSLRPVTSGWNSTREVNFANAEPVLAKLGRTLEGSVLEQKNGPEDDHIFLRPDHGELAKFARELDKEVLFYILMSDMYDGTAIYYQYTAHRDGTVSVDREP